MILIILYGRVGDSFLMNLPESPYFDPLRHLQLVHGNNHNPHKHGYGTSNVPRSNTIARLEKKDPSKGIWDYGSIKGFTK